MASGQKKKKQSTTNALHSRNINANDLSPWRGSQAHNSNERRCSPRIKVGDLSLQGKNPNSDLELVQN